MVTPTDEMTKEMNLLQRDENHEKSFELLLINEWFCMYQIVTCADRLLDTGVVQTSRKDAFIKLIHRLNSLQILRFTNMPILLTFISDVYI